jgi:hypothetical protein
LRKKSGQWLIVLDHTSWEFLRTELANRSINSH